MGKRYDQLDLDDRIEISRLHAAGTAASQGFRAASRMACDVPHRYATRSWPKALGNRLYGSLSTLLGIIPSGPGIIPAARLGGNHPRAPCWRLCGPADRALPLQSA